MPLRKGRLLINAEAFFLVLGALAGARHPCVVVVAVLVSEERVAAAARPHAALTTNSLFPCVL